MTSGPVVSAGMFDCTTRKVEDAVRDLFAEPVGRLVADAEGRMAHLVREAYLTGLRDGFAQGVLDAHRSENNDVVARAAARDDDEAQGS